MLVHVELIMVILIPSIKKKGGGGGGGGMSHMSIKVFVFEFVFEGFR